MIINNNKKFIYMSIPKVASTTLHRFFNKSVEHSHVRWDAIEVKSENKEIDYNKFFSFTVVRNPWQRLYSCWKDKCFIDDKYLENAPFFKKHKYVSFDRFVSVVGEQIKENHWCDPHIRPMNKLLSGYKENLEIENIDYVGKIETLNCDIECVLKNLKVQCEFPNMVLNKGRGVSSNYADVYTKDIIERVGSIYEADIVKFGYSFA